jgi:hypothetical protein
LVPELHVSYWSNASRLAAPGATSPGFPVAEAEAVPVTRIEVGRARTEAHEEEDKFMELVQVRNCTLPVVHCILCVSSLNWSALQIHTAICSAGYRYIPIYLAYLSFTHLLPLCSDVHPVHIFFVPGRFRDSCCIVSLCTRVPVCLGAHAHTPVQRGQILTGSCKCSQGPMHRVPWKQTLRRQLGVCIRHVLRC